MIIDAQLHEPGPHHDWPESDEEARLRVMTDITLALMEAVGVDRVVIHPGDNSFAEYAYADHPDLFCWVPQIMRMPDDPPRDYGAEVADLAGREGVRGIRLIIGFPPTGENAEVLEAGGFDDVFTATAEAGLPIFVFAPRFLKQMAKKIEANPGINIVIDHMGIPQPPMDEPDSPPWAALPDLLALAQYPTAYVKVSGAPSLSSQGEPWDDVWPALEQIIEAFGAERCLWASDFTRFMGRVGFMVRIPHRDDYPGRHSYADSLALFKDSQRLTPEQKDLILAGTVQKLVGWP
jgi:L-fuconolactonase